VAGDVLHPADVAPSRERDRDPRRRALGGGDAGHDLDRDSSRPTSRDLLAAAAENHGVAALEPHHAPAGLGERDHQRIDLALPAGRPIAGLADQHLLRLAAGKIEDFRRDQVVDQDDVGRLQRAHRAQREELRIARAGADQRDGAGSGNGCLVSRRRQQRVEIGRRRRTVGMADRKAGEQLPEPPPGRKRQPRRLDRRPPAPRRLRPAREAAREHGFELAADRLREDRRRAVGRNADHQRRAVDDGAEGKIAIGRLVDHVDRHATRARRRGEAPGIAVVLEAAHRDRRAGEVRGLPTPMMQCDRAARRLRGEGAKLLAGVLGKDVDGGSGGRKQLRFPRRRRPVAGDDGTLAVEREEHRQPRQRLHARRASLRGASFLRHQCTSCR